MKTSRQPWILVVGGACALPALAGCGSAGGDSAANGSEAPAASIAAPAWSTAAATPAQLLGLWVAADAGSAGHDEKSVRMERGIAECTMQFDFRDAQQVFIQLGRDVDLEEGRWEVVRTEGSALVLKITSPSCGETEFRVEFTGENRFTMSQVGQSDLAFTLTRLRGAVRS
jgi:hypothetical protein